MVAPENVKPSNGGFEPNPVWLECEDCAVSLKCPVKSGRADQPTQPMSDSDPYTLRLDPVNEGYEGVEMELTHKQTVVMMKAGMWGDFPQYQR